MTASVRPQHCVRFELIDAYPVDRSHVRGGSERKQVRGARDRTKTREMFLDRKAELRAAILRMVDGGSSHAEAAETFGLSRARIRQICGARSRGGAT